MSSRKALFFRDKNSENKFPSTTRHEDCRTRRSHKSVAQIKKTFSMKDLTKYALSRYSQTASLASLQGIVGSYLQQFNACGIFAGYDNIV